MTQSQKMYEFANAVADLSYDTDSARIPIDFYGDAMRVAEDETVEDIRDQELDNVVLDPSVVLEPYANTTWEAEFNVYDPRKFNALDELYAEDLAYHWTEGGEDEGQIGVFEDTVEPEDIFEVFGDLGDEVDFYIPDHMTNCVNGKRDELTRYLRNNELDYDIADGLGQAREDINQIRGELVTGLNQIGKNLPAMANYGVFDSYEETNFNNKNVSEDDLIEKEAEKLDGFTVVATFDQGFIERDIPAFPPNLIDVLWD